MPSRRRGTPEQQTVLDSQEYQRARAHCFATETHCRRCGKPVDMELPHRDPVSGRVNRWSKSFGHTVEVDAGGDVLVGGLEHFFCNVSAGASYVNAKRRGVVLSDRPLTTSDDLYPD